MLSAFLAFPFVLFVELLLRNSRKWNKNVYYWGKIKKNNKKNFISTIIFSLAILCMLSSGLFVLFLSGR
jgi:hypothetical protein